MGAARSRPWRYVASAAAAALLTGCFPPSRWTGPRLEHFPDRAPAPGEPAPAFTLETPDGESVALSELVGERPLVLQVGSWTCPVFRYRRFGMEDLWRDYAGRVDFLIVYSREAHPVGSPSPYRPERDEWVPWINRVAGVDADDPGSLEERRVRASTVAGKLEHAPILVVDGMDDRVWSLYGSAPSPAYVLDREGRVVLRQVWTDPEEIRHTLDRLLAGASAPARSTSRPP